MWQGESRPRNTRLRSPTGGRLRPPTGGAGFVVYCPQKRTSVRCVWDMPFGREDGTEALLEMIQGNPAVAHVWLTRRDKDYLARVILTKGRLLDSDWWSDPVTALLVLRDRLPRVV